MRELTIESDKANGIAMAFLVPVAVVSGIVFFYLWHDSIDLHHEIMLLKKHTFAGLFILVFFVIIHELLHALAYLFLTKGDFKSISFGIIWKNLTPYCHYSKAISMRQYRIAVALPGLITGIIPLIISMSIGSFSLLVFALLFTLGAMGDFSILWISRKEKSNTMLKDHPDKIGCIILD